MSQGDGRSGAEVFVIKALSDIATVIGVIGGCRLPQSALIVRPGFDIIKNNYDDNAKIFYWIMKQYAYEKGKVGRNGRLK